MLVMMTGCKEKESPLSVLCNIDGLNWQYEYAQGNYVYQLQTTAKSTTGAVRHVVISTFDPIYSSQTILDTILQDPIKEFKLISLYRTPVFEDTTRVKFSTTVYATDGESGTYSFSISVLPSETPLQPIDGVTLHSALSGNKSYFSLTTMQPVLAVDSGEIYFRDVAPKDSTDELSLSWTSPMIYFSRSENFDYAKATASSVINTYNSCTRDHTILQLKEDDVILFGTSSDALGVLKVMVIEDKDGCANDRYIFSMKALPKSK